MIIINIVIFGCDNTGKTTLGENLMNYFKSKAEDSITYVHSPGPASKEVLINFMEDYTSNQKSNVVIFDRFPIIEESVYGKLLRGHNDFDNEQYNKSILDKIDLFIYCNPGLSYILNWGDREQMSGVKENAIDIINEYNKVAYKLINDGYNVKEYNYRCDSVEDLINGIN